MDFDFLPIEISNALYKLDQSKIQELRLRANSPVKLIYDFNACYLSKNGITILKSNAIICTYKDLEEIILSVTDYSIYAVNDTIINGYVTSKDGIRIGIAGECVVENGKIKTISAINSLCVRIPHFIDNAGQIVFNLLLKEKLSNVLIVSPPRKGKTTLLKSLIRYLDGDFNNEILVIDERGELFVPETNNVDYVRFSTKLFAFEYGVRSLSPNIVITDELMDDGDFNFVHKAIYSGVKIIATIHAENIKDLENKKHLRNGLFDYYVILSSGGQVGKIEQILDGEKNALCL